MSPTPPLREETRVNDFSIRLASANGTGSQTANTALLRALFRMGIPVSGKNLFPSNIQGLPTWFTIRVSRDGWTARPERPEILVAFNKATLLRDVGELPPGGVCLHPDHLAPPPRDDVVFYPLPVRELVKESGVEPRFKDYVANMVYVGALAALLDIELGEIEAALGHHFGDRARLVERNMALIRAAADRTAGSLTKTDPYRVEPMDGTRDLILVDGNAAAALGALAGGLTFASWYPITPASSLAESIAHYARRIRRDPDTGRSTVAVVQAEDEMAALGMVVGAGWTGARAMTSTSGPGLSLMAEIAGLAWFAEVPVVVWDIQRTGPSTGLPTRTSQGDVLTAHHLSHGETIHPVLLPGTVGECFTFAHEALDLAERLQTPVFVLSDLDLGMNAWMTPPFAMPEGPLDRGKVLAAEDVDETYRRYRDVDGDGICPRTLPGNENPHSTWLARGTGHDEAAGYSEDPEHWSANLDRLRRKIQSAAPRLPAPVVERTAGATVGVLHFGSSAPAVAEARARLAEDGLDTSALRVRALPFSDEVRAFLEQHERVHVVECNADGQMRKLLRMSYGGLADRTVSIRHADGLPLSASRVATEILEREESR
jgi:2-oxoglutarate ferredoxin oxidoreductase subunit alpha